MACRAALGALVMFAWTCSGCGSPTAPSTLEGTWGGDHISMSVGETTRVELDCAHGSIASPIVIDSQRQFGASGTFVLEHGGPVRNDEPEDAHPASYSGSISGDRMLLTIRLTESNQTVGAFSLSRGSQGRVVKCL